MHELKDGGNVNSVDNEPTIAGAKGEPGLSIAEKGQPGLRGQDGEPGLPGPPGRRVITFPC